jgi:putative transposase
MIDDSDLGRFMQRLTTTHVRRWHLHRRTVGHGHLYQGLYKSFPIQQDEHFLTVCRYVERNALRAKLVRRAEDWTWSSLAQRCGPAEPAREKCPSLTDWPVERPSQWLRMVNAVQSEAEVTALRRSVQRGRPFGSDTWEKQAATRLGLQSTLRPRGRPRKQKAK